MFYSDSLFHFVVCAVNHEKALKTLFCKYEEKEDWNIHYFISDKFKIGVLM